jgi:cell division protein FtsB
MEARREQTEKLEELKKERSELEMKIAELEGKPAMID